MTAEIIPFPKANARLENKLPTHEELEQIDPTDQTVSTAAELLGTSFVDSLISLGYPISPTYAKDICFVVEAMKSLMCRYYDQQHPYQSLADLSFKPDDAGMLQFTHPRVKIARPNKRNEEAQGNNAPVK